MLAPNRLTLITAALAAVATFVISLLDAFENETMKAVVCGVALVCLTALATVYVIGWQKFESRQQVEAQTYEQKDLHQEATEV